MFSYQLDLGIGILDEARKALLDALNLLGNGTQNSFFESIEFIETPPSANLAQTNKDTTHCLEVKSLITTENQHKAAKLNTKCLDRFGFAYSTHKQTITHDI